MLLIHHGSRDPYYNIALEEHLLKNQDEEVIMLWWSRPSVIIGKHQNAFAEINLPFVRTNDIPVIRRLSGGGTVFHAPGNLNFTFIFRGEPGNMINFRKYTAPVIAFLNDLGVEAQFAGKNDIRAGGLKISGNAEHIYKDRVLHHGTLLYNADLEVLQEAIRVSPRGYKDTSIQSVRSKVANISGLLENPPAFDRFAGLLEQHLARYYGPVTDYQLTLSDHQSVERLVGEKYRSREWNYARSPSKYEFTGNVLWSGQSLTCALEVRNGHISFAHIDGSRVPAVWEDLSRDLSGRKHDPDEIFALLKKHGLLQGDDSETFPLSLYPLFF